jgi:hypothetical protein
LFLLLAAFKMFKEEYVANENKNGEKIVRFFKISNILDGDKYLTKINSNMFLLPYLSV